MKLSIIRPVRLAALSVGIGILAAALAVPPAAAETIHYVYDARGRLVEVERVQPSATVKTKYTYDRADNRTKKEVTTTP